MEPTPDLPRYRARLLVSVLLAGLFITALVWSALNGFRVRPGGSVQNGEATGVAVPQAEAPPGTPVYTDVLSVYDADFRAGQWFVLDRRQDRVHRFDAGGRSIGSFGRSGSGPGEFRAPEALAVHGDTLVVAELNGQVHWFDPKGGYIESRRVRVNGCPAFGLFDVESSPAGVLYLGVCPLAGTQGARVLQEARVLLEMPPGSFRTLAVYRYEQGGGRALSFSFQPVLSPHPRGFVFGSAGEDCLQLFNLQGLLLDSLCHRWIEKLPLPENWRETREEMEQHAKRAGLGVEALDAQLPFYDIFVTENGRLVYVSPAPEGDGMRRLLVREDVASAVRAVELEVAAAPFVAVGESTVLAAWEDLEGMRIAVYPWSLSEN